MKKQFLFLSFLFASIHFLYATGFTGYSSTNDTIVCEKSSSLYQQSLPGLLYNWSVTSGGTILSASGNQATIYWNMPGTDTVKVITQLGVSLWDTTLYIVEVKPKPNPNILASFTATCKVDTTQSGPQGHADRGNCIAACDSMLITYFTNNTPGHTYNWTISNGSILSGNGTSSVNVIWGNLGWGTLTVVETTPFGCIDSTDICVQIFKSPKAKFIAPTSVCLNTPFGILDSSTGGVVNWFWDFGDGNTLSYNAFQPVTTHSYSSPGTYTITLVVWNQCGCSDTTTRTIVVDALPGPEIVCITPVCEDSCATYSTPAVCGSYLWTISGGTLISGQGTPNIQVCWGAGPLGSITLLVSGCSPATCIQPVTVYVPILSKNLNITGPNPVCVGDLKKYCLPCFPGSVYTWTVPTGGTIVAGQGGKCIDVQWQNFAGNGEIQVVVNNPLLKCEGRDTLQVSIRPEYNVFNPKSEFCLGDTGQFFASGPAFFWAATGGFILSGQGTGSVQIVWTATGSQTVTVWPTNPNLYCNDTTVVNVSVTTVARPDSISGPMQICPGQAYTYTAFSSTPSVVFEWIITGGTPTSITGNPISVTWDAAPTQPYCLAVRHRMTDDPFCPSDTILMCVDSFPTPIVTITGGNGCASDTSSYSATVFPGATYNWIVSPPSMGSVVGGQGTPNAQVQWTSSSGPATVVCLVTLCNNTGTGTLPVTVFPSPTPVIAILGTLCPGGSVNLNAGPGVTYVWSDGQSGNPITVTTQGNYTVTVTNANGCSATATVFVPEAPGPVAKITTTDPLVYCTGTPISTNLTALWGTGYTFAWSTGAITQSILVTSPGTYCVTVTKGLCTAITCRTISVVSCPGGCPTPPCPPPCNPSSALSWNWNYLGGRCNTITFNNTSPAGFNFSWNFGDGNGSTTMPTVSHIYTEAGFYLASLTGNVMDVNGIDTCTLVSTQAVHIPIVANFKFTPACPGSPASFFDMTTSTSPGPFVYSWAFGDGNVSGGINPTNTYLLAGSYNVTLTVTGPTCNSTIVKTIVINPAPTPNFAVSSPVCQGTPASFTDLTTPSGALIQWNWNFGDGNQSTAQNPLHTYMAPGVYPVTLQVTDSAGCTGTSNLLVTVIPVTPDTIVYFGPLVHCPGETDTLFAPAGLSWLWSNGLTANSIVVNSTGNYSVTVTDFTGCTYVAGPVSVTFQPAPNAIILANPGNPVCLNQSVTLCTPQAAGYTYSWYHITGNYSLGTSPCVSLFSFAPQTVQLIVTNNIGCSDTSAPWTLNIFPQPSVSIMPAGPTAFCDGDSVTLNTTVTGTILAYNWSNGTSTSSITVKNNGPYCVTVTSIDGCEATDCQNVTVWPMPDMCLVLTGCIEVCDNDTIPGPAGYASYQWVYNGTNVSPANCGTCQNLPVIGPGLYQLILTTINGCTDTSGTLEVFVEPCDSSDCYAAIDPVFKKILSSTTITNQVTVWDGKYYLGPNVVLTISGGVLDITNVDVVFDTCAGIELTNGAMLRANNSVFRPCDLTKSWRGIEFKQGSTGILNENTFKNAQYALLFWGGIQNSYARVVNNLFSNCKWGVTVVNNKFEEAITGNTFVQENTNINFDNTPCPVYTPFSNTYWGVFGYGASFYGLISQNDFINTNDLPSNKRMHGIYLFKSSGRFTMNTFTNMYRTADLVGCVDVTLEQNTVENTRTFSPIDYQIRVTSSGNVRVLGNTIRNHTDYLPSNLNNSAVYFISSSQSLIAENHVMGYKTAFQIMSSNYMTIVNNVVRNSKLYGIYMENGQFNDIACNDINMDARSQGGVVGIGYFQTLQGNAQHKIRSNCVMESWDAILLQSTQAGNAIPRIRNNYLYNYSNTGVRNFNFTGNIGNSGTSWANAGKNSFISNNIPGGALDISSNVALTAGGNFGIVAVSSSVTTIGTGAFNSTASCGHQIGTINSQIGADEICDDLVSSIPNQMVEKTAGGFALKADVISNLQTIRAEERLELMVNLLAVLHTNSTLTEAEKLIQQIVPAVLSSSEASFMRYYHQYLQQNWVAANSHLQSIAPQNGDERSLLTIEGILLAIARDGRSVYELSSFEAQALEFIVSKEDRWMDYAQDILQSARGDHDHFFRPVRIAEDLPNETPVMILDNDFVHVYPNPVRNEVQVSFYFAQDIENAEIVMTTIDGRIIEFRQVAVNSGVEIFNTEGFPRGIYLISLRVDGKILQAKKMVKL